jgi:Glutaredoxin
MKEFLLRHGVPFVSVNVLDDPDAREELAALGVRTVPIVARGSVWANGQVLADVARVAGITPSTAKILPPAELYRRLTLVQTAAQRFFAQIPDDRIALQLPGRPRSYADLAFHIFHIAELFIAHMTMRRPLVEGDYNRVPPALWCSKGSVLAYGRGVQTHMHIWWQEYASATDFAAPADVYYGVQTVHEFMERTTWHSGQHVRQLALVLQHLGITPDRPLGPAVWADLPMPEKVWDDDAAQF